MGLFLGQTNDGEGGGPGSLNGRVHQISTLNVYSNDGSNLNVLAGKKYFFADHISDLAKIRND